MTLATKDLESAKSLKRTVFLRVFIICLATYLVFVGIYSASVLNSIRQSEKAELDVINNDFKAENNEQVMGRKLSFVFIPSYEDISNELDTNQQLADAKKNNPEILVTIRGLLDKVESYSTYLHKENERIKDRAGEEHYLLLEKFKLKSNIRKRNTRGRGTAAAIAVVLQAEVWQLFLVRALRNQPRYLWHAFWRRYSVEEPGMHCAPFKPHFWQSPERRQMWGWLFTLLA